MAKCRNCGKEFKKTSDMLKIRERIYVCDEHCKSQYELKELEKKKPKPKKVKKPKKEKYVDKNWTELMDYLNFLYDGDVNYPFICSQIKHMKQTYNFKTSGILLTLKYYIEILNMPFNQEYGITNIITKYYKRAKQNYIDMLVVQKEFDNFEFKDNIITIKNNNKNTKKTNKLKIEEF